MFSFSNKRTLSNNLILIWLHLHDSWVTHQMLVHLFGVPHLFLVMFDLALDKTEQDLDDVILLQAIINHNYHSKDPRNQSSEALFSLGFAWRSKHSQTACIIRDSEIHIFCLTLHCGHAAK